MQLNKQDIEAIKANNMAVPVAGTYTTAAFCAEVSFARDTDGTVKLDIKGQWFNAAGIKELRKFLKILEAEIK